MLLPSLFTLGVAFGFLCQPVPFGLLVQQGFLGSAPSIQPLVHLLDQSLEAIHESANLHFRDQLCLRALEDAFCYDARVFKLHTDAESKQGPSKYKGLILESKAQWICILRFSLSVSEVVHPLQSLAGFIGTPEASFLVTF